MSETRTVWHPFPKEKPPEPLTWYLVTLQERKGKRLYIDLWSGSFWLSTGIRKIIAWAELPEPYKPD